MHYLSKQDLASAYFPDNSKETASKRFAHEIHSNKTLLAALQAAGLLAALRPTGYRPAQKRLSPPPPTPNPLLLPRRALKRNRAPMSKIK